MTKNSDNEHDSEQEQPNQSTSLDDLDSSRNSFELSTPLTIGEISRFKVATNNTQKMPHALKSLIDSIYQLHLTINQQREEITQLKLIAKEKDTTRMSELQSLKETLKDLQNQNVNIESEKVDLRRQLDQSNFDKEKVIADSKIQHEKHDRELQESKRNIDNYLLNLRKIREQSNVQQQEQNSREQKLKQENENLRKLLEFEQKNIKAKDDEIFHLKEDLKDAEELADASNSLSDLIFEADRKARGYVDQLRPNGPQPFSPINPQSNSR